MWITLVLKALLSFGNATIKFIREYFVQVMCALFCICLSWVSYKWGHNNADSDWIVYHNKMVLASNDKISNLETMAEQELNHLKRDNRVLQDKLIDLANSAPVIVAHDKDGKVLRCGKDVITIYLGGDFKEAWNNINAESEK